MELFAYNKGKIRIKYFFTQNFEYQMHYRNINKTALFCLSQHDWKLDIALDNYFANPELYYRESKVVTVDRKKLEAMYNKYRGK